MSDLASRLLAAHVEHALARLQGDELRLQLEDQVRACFDWFSQVELCRVVTKERVMEAIDRFAIELRVSGGITELTGEIARVIVTSDQNAKTRLDEILSTRSFRDFSDKLLALEGLRRELISLFVRSSALTDAASRLLSHRITDFLSRPVKGERPVFPRELAHRLRTSKLPELERRMSAWLFQHLERGRERYARELEERLADAVDETFLRSLLDDVWADASRLSLSHVIGFLGEQDLEDAVTFVFEFWLRFRQTDYFRHAVEAGVTHFFAKYGGESVADVIEDMGVTQEMVAKEWVASVTPWVQAAMESGFLEAQLRQELESFYLSDACVALLSARGQ